MNGTHLNTLVPAHEDSIKRIMRAVARTERPTTDQAADLLLVSLRWFASGDISPVSVDSVLTEARYRARVVQDPAVRADLERLSVALEGVTPYEV